MKGVLIGLGVVLLSGCAVMPSIYSYRILNDDCNCREYRLTDKEHKIQYLFRAEYKMHHGVVTKIEIELDNRSRDTLDLSLGTVKVTSKNISYQYNDKFLPLPHIEIPPHDSEVVELNGGDTSGSDDWNKIAGEQLTVTLQGIRLGEKILPQLNITLRPENPNVNVK